MATYLTSYILYVYLKTVYLHMCRHCTQDLSVPARMPKSVTHASLPQQSIFCSILQYTPLHSVYHRTLLDFMLHSTLYSGHVYCKPYLLQKNSHRRQAARPSLPPLYPPPVDSRSFIIYYYYRTSPSSSGYPFATVCKILRSLWL